MRLSDHFTLEELTVSETATRNALDNTPPDYVQPALQRLANSLEQVRSLLGNSPIIVMSGYRSPAVNARVGGAPHSWHMAGLAADFLCPGYGSPKDICKRLLAAGLPFDQLIYEGNWVHWAIPRDPVVPLKQVLTAKFYEFGPRYSRGIGA